MFFAKKKSRYGTGNPRKIESYTICKRDEGILQIEKAEWLILLYEIQKCWGMLNIGLTNR